MVFFKEKVTHWLDFAYQRDQCANYYKNQKDIEWVSQETEISNVHIACL